MTKDVYESAEAVKKMIDKSTNDIFEEKEFLKHRQFYFWTNEDIRSCLNQISLVGMHRGLTVLSSGDHPFNLIAEGILNIDTFDINKLTEYFALGFKRAMILKYSYNEFLDIMEKIYSSSIASAEVYDIIFDLLDCMETSHKIFWQEILNYIYSFQKIYGCQVDLFKILAIDVAYLKPFSFEACNYTNSAEKYNLLKSNLGKANITFKNLDILEVPKNFNDKKYDIIMLSNILDYFYNKWGNNWTYDRLQLFEKSFADITNEDGIIFLLYLYGWTYNDFLYPFNSNNVSSKDLTDEELVTFPSCFNSKSGAILKRVKK